MFHIGLYFLPTLVALVRGSDRPLRVFLVNFFFGWTVIGWVVALLMASRDRRYYCAAPYGYYPVYPRRF